MIAISAPGRILSLFMKIRHMRWRDRFLYAEALVYLSWISPAIRLVPFRVIGRMASRPVRGREPEPGERRILIYRIRRAIAGCAKRVPWECVCFQQGLAAHLMLRRRGVASTLYYGAANDSVKGLNAHVWVRAGDIDVIGTENASEFAILARFPHTRTIVHTVSDDR
jgi:hypothetical protein